jgi:phosphohistidine phosphatase
VQVLIVRHAIAEDRVTFAATGEPDGRRPLTDGGRRRMATGARGLRRLVPRLTRIATSPLVRAAETAEILAAAYDDDVPVEELAALAPGGEPDGVVSWLHPRAADACIALVGHEPDLGELTAYLLLEDAATFFSFKKGGAALLEFDGPVGAGQGSLRWLMQPKHLRALGSNGG